jgi:hypothetical protein
MRILVATYHTVPGYSGGWATPLDLLTPGFDVSYVAALGREGTYELEGVRVAGLGRSFRVADPLTRPRTLPGRIAKKLSEQAFGRLISREYRRLRPRFVLCLDILTARQCISRRIPYAIRIHSEPAGTPPAELRRLIDGALFSTACQMTGVQGVEILPHSVDLHRFPWTEASAAEEAVMVTVLYETRLPMLFVEGVMGSSLRGTIVGDGPLRDRVEKACRDSGGRMTFREPVLRTGMPSLLAQYQIGVACHREVPSIYQMKVPEYQAAGLFPLVMPWNHLALEAPELTGVFRTAGELSMELDRVAEHWTETLHTRQRGREFALARYDVSPAKARFLEILKESGLR